MDLDTLSAGLPAPAEPAAQPLRGDEVRCGRASPPDGRHPASRWAVRGRALALGGRRTQLRGVTYGPFPPNLAGEPFPETADAQRDFALMHDAGVEAIRTYCPLPDWFLGLAEDRGVAVLVDIPWAKHLCFLDGRRGRAEARDAVRRCASVGAGFASPLGYSIGNEIPPDVVRWHGRRRIERFLGELADTARQADPRALVTYANYPPTEYLELPFLDFVTFNVYLHDRETFRRYLLRLLNMAGDLPLVLGELGMDSLRNGEPAQAAFLAGHLREAALLGVAGTFVFSWTDLWHTGGHLISDWQFGITRTDRAPKAAFEAVASVAVPEPAGLLARTPRVSVVVCSFNGGGTLAQCLESLGRLRYPEYEVILVDDGSTDDTPAIAARFPQVRTIRQENLGLSESRNVGLRAATGEIVAYTDADCFADPDWLTHLVHQLETTGADAVGGPNLTPDDGWVAACIDASPGQPTHVLESDQVAEHVPGCNMAFRRRALEAINGFDPQFLRAGDDVDVCWRLQESGLWITFAPGAFVWHHRRQTPRAYFRQQSGYGEAEALLRFKHPEKCNARGSWKWQGVLYGASLRGLQLRSALIYRGQFGTGLFQCLYQPAAAHWAMLPSTLEWQIGAAFFALNAFVYPPAGLVAAAMVALSLLVAVLQALQARLPARHDGLGARATVAVLSYAQPLVRSWAHYATRASSYRAIDRHPAEAAAVRPLGWRWRNGVDYWSETPGERTALVSQTVADLRAAGWGVTLDSGWSDWDAEIFGHAWSCVRVTSVQEEHGSGRRLVRLRFGIRPTWKSWLAALGAAVSVALAASWRPEAALVVAGVLLLAAVPMVRHARRLASRILEAFDRAARDAGLLHCDPGGARGRAP